MDPDEDAASLSIDAAAPDSALAGTQPSTAPAGPVGHLVGPQRLAHLFEALARLGDGHSHDHVRILQYGDSHTASDLGVGVFRRALQARFGDGGRGFVSIGKPWKTYVQDGIRAEMTKDFEPAKVKYRNGSFSGVDGCYGLLGVGVAASKAGARASTSVAAPSSRVEIAYGQDPHGGRFEVLVDGARAGQVSTRATQAGSSWFSLDVADKPHEIELHAAGDGVVRVFGMNLDRAGPGVVVDALGINGAQIFTPLRWAEPCFAEQVAHASPALVILAYGTNEALEPGLTDADYERKLVELLGRVARAVPASSCLLLGPPDLARHTKGQDDWKTWPRVHEIAAVQRKVAEAAGCAFYDQIEAMGGPGSIVAWAAEAMPRAGRDRVHLTRSGYAQLATAFASDLMRAYDDWRAAKGLPAAVAAPPASQGGP